MTTPTPFTLAPVGVLRAAAWPIECLDRFGDVTLAKLALEAAPSSAQTWQTYVETYHQVFERERQHLRQMTLDSRFLKALRLSNPIVSAKVNRCAMAKEQLQPRTKIIRRLENTLYRYLARAVGRTTPNGLWAGVGLVQFAEESPKQTQLESTSSRYFFSPDLRPFQTVLRSLAHQTAYRDSTYWRINPTLIQHPDCPWRFWARTKESRVKRCEIESNEMVDILLEVLIGQESGTFSELLSAVQASQPWIDLATLRNQLEVLADGGILLGGLDLPHRFNTPWDALSIAAQQLTSQHQSLWNRAIDRLKDLCDHLDASIEVMPLERLEAHLIAATQCVTELAKALGVVLHELPNPLLHCDLKLPFQVTLEQTQRHTLLRVLRTYESCWLDGISPTTALRHFQREQLAHQLQHDIAIGEITPDTVSQASWSLLLTDGQLAVNRYSAVSCRLKSWESLLLQHEADVVLEVANGTRTDTCPKAPLGCLYFLPFQDFRLVVRGIDDDPARAFARFGQFLDTDNSLHTWLQQSLEYVSDHHQLVIADLQVPFEVNPNVLARAAFSTQSIALWSAGQDTLSLRDAKIGIEPITGLPVLKVPSLSKPLAVFGFSSANVSVGDPLAEILFYTGFQERPISNVSASTIVSTELVTPHFAPRISLPGGAIIRPRRTVLSGRLLEELTHATPLERYTRWQQLATEQQWPTLLTLQIDEEPPLPIRRDSPLALEALFKSVRVQTRWLVVEELVDAPWLVDSEGQHYMAEIALPFLRAEHGWSPRTNEHPTFAVV